MEKKKNAILDIFSSFNFKGLSDDIIFHIKLDNDLLKGFQSNRKVYNHLLSEVNPNDEMIFFDICQLLGLFSKSGSDLDMIIYAIKFLYNEYSVDEIKTFIGSIKNIVYNEKLAHILMSAIVELDLKDNLYFFGAISNNFKEFSKDLEKINKNRIRMLTIKGPKNLEDAFKLKVLKSQGKSITMLDVIDYMNKVKLLRTRDDLKQIRRILLLGTYDSLELNEILEFYEYAKSSNLNDEEYFENIKVHLTDGYTVEWLSSLDPINLVLGYIFKVCSTFSGTGSKIMIDGILDSRNKHIAIKDSSGTIIAKSTCIINGDYIFCNSLVFTESKIDSLTREEEKNFYYYYMCAVNKQLESLKLRGIDIREIKIATDQYTILRSLQYREDSNDFKELLSKASYYWEEFDENLFDHLPPQYILEKKQVQ